MKPFRNEPPFSFADPKILKKQHQAVAEAARHMGERFPLVIGGEQVKSDGQIVSYNPSNKSEVVARFAKATQAHAEQAIQAASAAFATWSRTPASVRAGYLFKAAAEMRRRRMEMNAWMILEVGKNFAEADADTCEAIDFLEYYGREMLRYDKAPRPVQLRGERDSVVYLPLGVGVVISPWNFPLAILTGMTMAAVVAGNTVIVKPSSDSPRVAWQLMDVLAKIKLPAGVVNFLPGPGGEVGDFLVAHPLTRFIAFTGSREVGLHINELAAHPQPGQKWIKRVVAEMGGKNAIVVDADADLDAAAQGIVTSAFGFQGQKCSACSRAVVVEKNYEKLVGKVTALTNALSIGEARHNMNVGPVINERAESTILGYIDEGRKSYRLMTGGTKAIGNGHFLEPTVFADVDPSARMAQEEIFGPVLAMMRVTDFDEALRVANGTEYGLTGAVYSRSRKRIEQARRQFHCGNLYVNRKCTGAIVGAHPFGGFNMSGTDSKAGGPDYLLLFLQMQSVAEKLR